MLYCTTLTDDLLHPLTMLTMLRLLCYAYYATLTMLRLLCYAYYATVSALTRGQGKHTVSTPCMHCPTEHIERILGHIFLVIEHIVCNVSKHLIDL